ncbi:hypothetical protein TSAR_005122 [Trichomalopsis sarcophagae]|uniref:Uncharacterized protein n=1 Tax=Trichomalopsis sarcophagae TaxID=543379 RepID=A0A232ENQ9_9HYME|nr:hypothetical protein TSAR_005122 [Trichomalopsis sarcophagae]
MATLLRSLRYARSESCNKPSVQSNLGLAGGVARK